MLLAAYVIARIVVLAGGTVFTSYDTFSYALRGDPYYDRGSLVSFTGHAPRLWGVPLFYAMFPDDWWRSAGQWAIGTAAWATLAWVVWTLFRHVAAKIVGAAAVLVLALLNFVGNLDFAILSESLSISLGVLVLALLIRWIATDSRPALVIMSVVAFWWTFTRPDIQVFTVIVILVLIAIAWRLPRRRVPAAIAAGTLVAAVAWCSAITPVASDTYKDWGAVGASYQEELFLLRLRVDVFPHPGVKALFENEFGMPPCPGAERSAARAEWDIVEFANEYRACPELAAWGEQNMNAFTRFAFAAPGEYLRMSYHLAGWSLSGGTYTHVPTIVPGVVHRLAFPGLPWSLPFTFGLVGIAVAFALLAGAYRAHRLAVWSATIIAAASTVSLLAGVAVAGGFWRLGIQEALGLRIAIIMLTAAALDCVLTRREASASTRSTGSADAESLATQATAKPEAAF
jgi:hypothetical protein